MRRILVTGAGGQLGRAVVRVISENGDAPIPLDHNSLDITDSDAVTTAFTSTQPDFVIHCAAWTNVDDAEDVTNVAQTGDVVLDDLYAGIDSIL